MMNYQVLDVSGNVDFSQIVCVYPSIEYKGKFLVQANRVGTPRAVAKVQDSDTPLNPPEGLIFHRSEDFAPEHWEDVYEVPEGVPMPASAYDAFNPATQDLESYLLARGERFDSPDNDVCGETIMHKMRTGGFAKYAGAALLLASAVVASGCSDDDSGVDSGVAPSSITEVASPAEGSQYEQSDSVSWDFTAPEGSEEWFVEWTEDSNDNGEKDSGDTTYSVDSGSTSPGSSVSGSSPLETIANSSPARPGRSWLTLGVSNDSGDTTLDVEVEVLDPDRLRVTGCYVTHANVGASLAIDCICSQTASDWSLTGGPTDSIITGSGAIATGRIMEVSDVGLHDYSVTCTSGSSTSEPYDFTVPVDAHRSKLVLDCSNSTTHDMLLPETSVDAVAQDCGQGFNPSNKPDTGADPDYLLDVDHTCVLGSLESLPLAELESHEHYNNGTFVSDVYSSCSVDFAQVQYIK